MFLNLDCDCKLRILFLFPSMQCSADELILARLQKRCTMYHYILEQVLLGGGEFAHFSLTLWRPIFVE